MEREADEKEAEGSDMGRGNRQQDWYGVMWLYPKKVHKYGCDDMRVAGGEKAGRLERTAKNEISDFSVLVAIAKLPTFS